MAAKSSKTERHKITTCFVCSSGASLIQDVCLTKLKRQYYVLPEDLDDALRSAGVCRVKTTKFMLHPVKAAKLQCKPPDPNLGREVALQSRGVLVPGQVGTITSSVVLGVYDIRIEDETLFDETIL